MEEVNFQSIPWVVAWNESNKPSQLVILPNNPQVLEMLCQAVPLPWKRPSNRKFLVLKWDMVYLVMADKGKGGDLLERITGAEPILQKKWECFYLQLGYETILS